MLNNANNEIIVHQSTRMTGEMPSYVFLYFASVTGDGDAAVAASYYKTENEFWQSRAERLSQYMLKVLVTTI